MSVRADDTGSVFVKPCEEHELLRWSSIDLRDCDGFRKVIYGCCNCHQLFDGEAIENELRIISKEEVSNENQET